VHEVVRVPVDEEGREMEAPEDRQAAKAARFRLTTSPGGGVVCLRNGDQRWEDASRRALPLRHTAEGDVEGRGALPITSAEPPPAARLPSTPSRPFSTGSRDAASGRRPTDSPGKSLERNEEDLGLG